MVKAYKDRMPNIGLNVYIDESAVVNGDVSLGDQVSIWFNASLRGDTGSITVGKGSNIQDNCCVHNSKGLPVEIGEYVTVGHGAILHSCTIGSNTLIGMGAIVLDKVVIGTNCLIGAGALLTPGMIIPDNSMVLGSPAKVIKEVTKDQINRNTQNALSYVELAKNY